jgi:pimeloyl-ACP methyl ester carboxylesterase
VTNRVIPRAGHLSNVDQPAVFTGLIEDFIGTLPR